MDLLEGQLHISLRARTPQNIALQTQEAGTNRLQFGAVARGGDAAEAMGGSLRLA